MTLTYASYLELDTLLDLQHPRSEPPEHDEMLFIVIHQTYELWFKLLLHELERAREELTRAQVYGAIHTFKRARTVMKTLVGQVDILETMTPMSFASFRDRLDTASGFQSVQFRELEFLLGHKRRRVLEHVAPESAARATLLRRLGEPSVYDGVYALLRELGERIPDDVIARAPDEAHEANASVQESLLRLYHQRPDLVILFELMTDLDEGLQEWRYRHVKMVERTIGAKIGTGGSSGVEFLKATLFRPVFPDLWAIRDRL